MADQWGHSDLQRLQSAVLTSEQVAPTLSTIIESVTDIRKNIADLGARINGDVGNVMVQADWQLLHDKTENAIKTVTQTATSNKTQADNVMQRLMDRMSEVESTMRNTNAKFVSRHIDMRALMEKPTILTGGVPKEADN